MAKNKLLLGTRKGLVVYEKRNGGWEFSSDHFLGISVSIATCDVHTGTWWAMLDHGHWGCKLHKSSDEGTTWEELEAPKYPEGEKLKDDKDATLKYLWAFASDQNGRLYFGTDPGGLFTSDDQGKSFTFNRGLWNREERIEKWFGGGRDNPGLHSVIVDPSDANHVYIAISCAGVFETTDGGETWVPRNKGLKADFLPDPNAEIGQDPHILRACPSDPDKMWQQNHCGVFRTIDGGQNWTDVSQENGPVKFGFAIAIDENDGDIAWVVPGISDECRVAVDQALCVCRTDDGGKSWQKFTNGLPQEACYDIVYRHALDITENSLAFGTTTGNLYLSDDRGENWECVNNHLAMVYSVAFI